MDGNVNGLMIDCSRLIERHDYYFRLVDFMADWGMNTLLLHFSDDHGLAIALPGFEDLAVTEAFGRTEIEALVAHAGERGIDIIPELETFGHTRYITDVPTYAHLAAEEYSDVLRFNAVDPLHPGVITLMERLIQATGDLFASDYIHLGCDEVDITRYCQERGLDEQAVWTDYVNQMIWLARQAGKEPMIWADHPTRDEEIARRLRKDVILVDWRYDPAVEEGVLPRRRTMGFERLVVAPSLACWHQRFLPTTRALRNTERMIEFGQRHEALGVINTVWCPYRYLQNALWYGVAYSAHVAEHGPATDLRAFHRRFTRDMFGGALTDELHDYLTRWPGFDIWPTISRASLDPNVALAAEEDAHLRQVNRLGRELLPFAARFEPDDGHDVWRGMTLAAQCAWLISERHVLASQKAVARRRRDAYRRLLSEVRAALETEWDATRFPDDPQKAEPKFVERRDQYALILMRDLVALSSS